MRSSIDLVEHQQLATFVVPKARRRSAIRFLYVPLVGSMFILLPVPGPIFGSMCAAFLVVLVLRARTISVSISSEEIIVVNILGTTRVPIRSLDEVSVRVSLGSGRIPLQMIRLRYLASKAVSVDASTAYPGDRNQLLLRRRLEALVPAA
jgi:hypothetical protein